MQSATLHGPLCSAPVQRRRGTLFSTCSSSTLSFHRLHKPLHSVGSCSSLQQPAAHSRLGYRSPSFHTDTARRHSWRSASAAAVSGAADAVAAQAEALNPPEPAVPADAGFNSLAVRSLFGTLLALLGVAVILAGGWFFTAAVCLVSYQASQEFYGFVTSAGISAGMQPPPPIVSSLTTLMCVGLSAWTYMSYAKSTAALAVSSFAVLSLQLLASDKPAFSQLASSVFGLFYCGYLPSFWVKLRLLAAPAVGSTAVHGWPVALGGLTHWTVGLIATFMSVACIIASDTGAYFFGKSLGRTQLIKISPKKTVEGAAGGLLCSILTALGLWRFFAWPASPVTAVAIAVLVFFASLFGDLIESVMKRDAGLKDASNLIPGHGGLLDRFDSYLFTGAIVFFFLKFVVPVFGL